MEQKVREFRTTEPIMCLQNDPIVGIAKWMTDENVSLIVVVDGYGTRKPIGVITLDDIETKVTQPGLDPVQTQVKDVWTTPAVMVSDDDTIVRAKAIMVVWSRSTLAVIDQSGACVGLVTRSTLPPVVLE